jgi:hypothetical protein
MAFLEDDAANLMEIDGGATRSQPINYIGPKTVSFSIDVGKVPNGQQYGVFFKRLHGGVWNYKRICGKVVQMMK